MLKEKALLVVQHERLETIDRVDQWRAFWKGGC